MLMRAGSFDGHLASKASDSCDSAFAQVGSDSIIDGVRDNGHYLFGQLETDHPDLIPFLGMSDSQSQTPSVTLASLLGNNDESFDLHASVSAVLDSTDSPQPAPGTRINTATTTATLTASSTTASQASFPSIASGGNSSVVGATHPDPGLSAASQAHLPTFLAPVATSNAIDTGGNALLTRGASLAKPVCGPATATATATTATSTLGVAAASAAQPASVSAAGLNPSDNMPTVAPSHPLLHARRIFRRVSGELAFDEQLPDDKRERSRVLSQRSRQRIKHRTQQMMEETRLYTERNNYLKKMLRLLQDQKTALQQQILARLVARQQHQQLQRQLLQQAQHFLPPFPHQDRGLLGFSSAQANSAAMHLGQQSQPPVNDIARQHQYTNQQGQPPASSQTYFHSIVNLSSFKPDDAFESRDVFSVTDIATSCSGDSGSWNDYQDEFQAASGFASSATSCGPDIPSFDGSKVATTTTTTTTTTSTDTFLQ